MRAPVGLTQLHYPSKVSKQQLADSAPQALYPLLIHNPLVKEAQAFQAPKLEKTHLFYELEYGPVIVNIRWFTVTGHVGWLHKPCLLELSWVP